MENKMNNDELARNICLATTAVKFGLPFKLTACEILGLLQEVKEARRALAGLQFSTPEQLAAAISGVSCYDETSAELIAEEMFKNAGLASC
ncbi:hypothetical protein QUQ16_004367 [Escherichia coli]|nr:hypothetical protein [Escherichia coli]